MADISQTCSSQRPHRTRQDQSQVHAFQACYSQQPMISVQQHVQLATQRALQDQGPMFPSRYNVEIRSESLGETYKIEFYNRMLGFLQIWAIKHWASQTALCFYLLILAPDHSSLVACGCSSDCCFQEVKKKSVWLDDSVTSTCWVSWEQASQPGQEGWLNDSGSDTGDPLGPLGISSTTRKAFPSQCSGDNGALPIFSLVTHFKR